MALPRCRSTVLTAVLLAACAPRASVPAQAPAPLAAAALWPEADRLFRQDPRWLGGDGAYSVDLGGGQTLWLFGDSFIAPASATAAGRRGAAMIHNSVAVQRGADPATATMRFHHGPRGFFADDGATWLWPGACTLVEGRLLIFLLEVRRQGEGIFGFRVAGSRALLVDNPRDDPSRWRTRPLRPPRNSWGALVGTGAALVHGPHLYAFSVVEPGSHAVHLARWTTRAVLAGDLSSPEWWSGEAWVAQHASRRPPRPLFADGQTELSVHHDARRRQFVLVQTVGLGASQVALRGAPAPEGPWSGARMVFRPPESGRARVLVYAAKAHPQLRGADLIVTYVANHADFAELLRDAAIYYPRFVRLHLR